MESLSDHLSGSITFTKPDSDSHTDQQAKKDELTRHCTVGRDENIYIYSDTMMQARLVLASPG